MSSVKAVKGAKQGPVSERLARLLAAFSPWGGISLTYRQFAAELGPPVTEAAIKKTLRELTKGRTTLIIAHRQSMMTDVDRVVAIRDGQVIEEGTPQTLFGQQGYFFQMMSAQASTRELRVQ